VPDASVRRVALPGLVHQICLSRGASVLL